MFGPSWLGALDLADLLKKHSSQLGKAPFGGILVPSGGYLDDRMRLSETY